MTVRVEPALPPTEGQKPHLEDREVAVLQELAREGAAWVAFQGLRRRLELHQESLTRTLRRLERSGLVAREDKGYRLTDQGMSMIRDRWLNSAPVEAHTIVEATLPTHVNAQSVVNFLSHRWFRGLRWYGQSGGAETPTLTWLPEHAGSPVRVRIDGGHVRLELEGKPTGQDFAAARGVLAALAELYGIVDAETSPIAGDAYAPSGFAA